MMIKKDKNTGRNLVDSGFSLAELELYTSYKAELKIGKRKLKKPKYYRDKMFEIRNELKEKTEKEGKSAEQVIKEYIKGLNRKSLTPFLTYALEFREINCASGTSLFLVLAEMLNHELYDDLTIGILAGVGQQGDHLMVRKRSSGEYIDFGETIPYRTYVEEFGRLPEIKPKKFIISLIFLYLGNHLIRLRRYKEAIEAYDKALRLDSKNAYAWNNRGVALWHLGKREEAIRCFDKALELDPQYLDVWNNKQVALKHLKDRKRQ